jgi:hypothetical protein
MSPIWSKKKNVQKGFASPYCFVLLTGDMQNETLTESQAKAIHAELGSILGSCSSALSCSLSYAAQSLELIEMLPHNALRLAEPEFRQMAQQLRAAHEALSSIKNMGAPMLAKFHEIYWPEPTVPQAGPPPATQSLSAAQSDQPPHSGVSGNAGSNTPEPLMVSSLGDMSSDSQEQRSATLWRSEDK